MPFYFYAIILGMVIGAAFTWFIVADHPFESREAPGGPVDPLEAGVLADRMRSSGVDLDEKAVTLLLQLHGAYVVGDELEPPADDGNPAEPTEAKEEPAKA